MGTKTSKLPNNGSNHKNKMPDVKMENFHAGLGKDTTQLFLRRYIQMMN
jgi:hypothetical protein